MAQWQYSMLWAELDRNIDFDEELQRVLEDYGMRGWELVQVLQPRDDTRYHLVFKLKDRYIRISNQQYTDPEFDPRPNQMEGLAHRTDSRTAPIVLVRRNGPNPDVLTFARQEQMQRSALEVM